MKEIGKVGHYYDKIGVAIIDLAGKLAVGDRVKFQSSNLEFEQEVSSMQIDHEQVEKAGKGKVVGIKVDKKVHQGTVVYKVE